MQNKTVMITGSATGIGKRIALDFAEKGYNIILNYRNSKNEAQNLLDIIKTEYQVTAISVQGDVSKEYDVAKIVEESLNSFGSIDVLINNAGPFIDERKTLVDYTSQEWHTVINGNLSSVFYLCKLIVPLMRANHWGRIINFGFNSAETAPPWETRSVYAVAKVGLVSLTKTLALEEAPHGITVNMICPGDIVDPWKESDILNVRNAENDGTPVGRMGSGEDVSRVILFLCNEQSDFLTGGVIPVTGGKTSFI